MDTKKIKRILEHLWGAQSLYEEKHKRIAEDAYNDHIESLVKELETFFCEDATPKRPKFNTLQEYFTARLNEIDTRVEITSLIDDKLFSQLFNRKVFGYNDGRLVTNGYLIGKHRLKYALMEFVDNTPYITYVEAISTKESHILHY